LIELRDVWTDSSRAMSTETHEATLIANGFDPRYLKTSRFFFLESFKKGQLELVEAFLACGMPFRAERDREPAIIRAAEGACFEAVQLALSRSGVERDRDTHHPSRGA
jgi:hypothetical protein